MQIVKLSLAISSLGGGGAERVLLQLASTWSRRGHEIQLVTLDAPAGDAYAVEQGIERVALDMMENAKGVWAAIANNSRRAGALRSAFRKHRAQVLVSFGDEMNVVALIASLGMPMRRIVSERTDPTLHTLPRPWRMLRRVVYPTADAVVVQTRALLPWAARVAGAKRVHAIPNPVRDLGAFASCPDATRDTLICAAGRLVAEKRFDVLLRAYAAIAAGFPRWTLQIVGTGPERAALESLAHTLGIARKVSFTGWLSEPASVFSRAGLFVLCSRYEGFPNALLEAMACGVPVISTECRGPVEIIRHGVDGWLVPVDAEHALSAAMRHLLADADLRGRLGRAATQVATRYDVERIADEWERLFSSEAPHATTRAGAVASRSQ